MFENMVHKLKKSFGQVDIFNEVYQYLKSWLIENAFIKFWEENKNELLDNSCDEDFTENDIMSNITESLMD